MFSGWDKHSQKLFRYTALQPSQWPSPRHLQPKPCFCFEIHALPSFSNSMFSILLRPLQTLHYFSFDWQQFPWAKKLTASYLCDFQFQPFLLFVSDKSLYVSILLVKNIIIMLWMCKRSLNCIDFSMSYDLTF